MDGIAFTSNSSSTQEEDGVRLAHQVQTINIIWVLLCSFLVVSMQLGFAMLEVGSCRQAHRMTVLTKNVLDSAVSCVGFAAVGSQQFGSMLRDSKGVKQPHLTLFYWGFCTTAVTICSGSLAERAHMSAYLCYAFLMSSVVFPCLAEGAWGQPGSFAYDEFHGRFSPHHDYHDFAGSGVVHLVGGVAALMGNILLGRRVMQSDADGQSADESAEPSELAVRPKSLPMFRELEGLEQEPVLCPEAGWTRRFDCRIRDCRELRKCNYLQAMGMFTLWVGWYGFNAGSVLVLDHGGVQIASAVAWHTSLAAAGGGIGSCLYCYCIRRILDVGLICNGVICGLVAITASCDVATESSSVIIGFCAGVCIYPLTSVLLEELSLDDPVDAIPVHFAGGLFGTLVVALCRPDCDQFVALTEGIDGSRQALSRFCLDNHTWHDQLAAQAWGALVQIVCAGTVCLLLFAVFATSEYARAVEAEYLKRADCLLCEMATGAQYSEAEEVTVEAEWIKLSKLSPTVRYLLKEDGWNGKGFQDGSPKDTWSLRSSIRDLRGRKFETALEGAEYWWHPVAFFGSMLGQFWLTRKLAVVRLRISPGAEISGLGATDNDGKSVFEALTRAMHSPNRNYAEQDNKDIEKQVRDLSAIVSEQDRVLQHLVTRGRSSSQSRAGRSKETAQDAQESLQPGRAQQMVSQLADVPEEDENAHTPPTGTPLVQAATCCGRPSLSASSTSSTMPPPAGSTDQHPIQLRGLGLNTLLQLAPVSAPRPPRSQVSSNTDASTLSNDDAGPLSPHSELDSTPPPSLIGARQLLGRVRHQRGRNDAALNDLTAAALQIAQALEIQQHMLQNMNTSGRARSSRSSRSASSRGSGSRSEEDLPRHIEPQIPASTSSQASSVTEEERPRNG